jgi:hypothetical protein
MIHVVSSNPAKDWEVARLLNEIHACWVSTQWLKVIYKCLTFDVNVYLNFGWKASRVEHKLGGLGVWLRKAGKREK